MPVLLHILNRPIDALVAEIIATQRNVPQNTVIVVDLTKPDANYEEMIEQIFAADSVASW